MLFVYICGYSFCYIILQLPLLKSTSLPGVFKHQASRIESHRPEYNPYLIHLHYTQLFILGLASLAPLRRLILSRFLLRISLGLSPMNRPGVMLGRRINSHNLQRNITCIQKLMLGSRGDNYYIPLLDLLLLASHNGLAGAMCEEQDLVDGVFLVQKLAFHIIYLVDPWSTYLIAYFSIHRDFHCNELRVESGMDDFAEHSKRAVRG